MALPRADQNDDVLWQKRQAIQIVMQLPDDREEALKVLAFARDLVTGWLADDEGVPAADVVRLVAL